MNEVVFSYESKFLYSVDFFRKGEYKLDKLDKENYLNKVVQSPIKVDLHIHSKYSSTKDENEMVADGTIEKLPVLIKKLNQYGVNMASITDHDFFSYSMYKAFKNYEGSGTIKKILPGVEFSLGIPNEKNIIKPVHVIAIFDDSSDEKLQKIETDVLKLKDKKVQYDLADMNLFSETKLIEILKNIGLDVVLIAHQKNSVGSKSKMKNDLNTIGEKKFDDFLTSEVFESLEFKSLRNGLFNNLFAMNMNKKANYDVVKFIKGSDCHQWEYYPKHDKNEPWDDTTYNHTCLKCLPTFKGLSMALSDYSRIQLGNSFFSVDDKKLNELDIFINGVETKIPLSSGINAIIGDNSIGKSLLLHKLTNYTDLKDSIKHGYEEYLKKNHIQIQSSIKKEDLYYFDSQGNIRNRFENKSDSKNQEFLNCKFPDAPNKEPYIQIINEEFSKFYACLQANLDFDEEYAKLGTLLMTDKDVKKEVLSINKLATDKKAMTGLSKVQSYLNNIIAKIADPLNYAFLEKDDCEKISKIKEFLGGLVNKYQTKYDLEKRQYGIRDALNQGILDYDEVSKAYKNEDAKINEEFDSFSDETATTFVKLLELTKSIKPFSFNIKEIPIKPKSLSYNGYNFIKRFKNVKNINNDYLYGLLKSCLKANAKIETDTITKEELSKILKEYDSNEFAPLDYLKKQIEEKINSDFEVETAILKSGIDEYDNLSNGLNATIYFDIIAGDEKPGIYIVDQPEDDVSQKAIKDSLIADFKNMSFKRQIILVTHNPQFVVNLDVDNVICIYKDKNEIKISSGALEYENKGTKENIIKLVADNLDGGVDAIRKRWKRYGKEIETN